MFLRQLILFTCLLVFGRPASAQESVAVEVSEAGSPVALDDRYLYYWENTTGRSIAPRKNILEQQSFKKIPGKVPNFGFIRHDVWFRFEVYHPEKEKQSVVLSLNNPNLDRAELFTELPSGDLGRIDQGDLIPYAERSIASRKIAFRLNLEAGERSVFYLRVNNGGEQFHFSPVLSFEADFTRTESAEQYYLGIYIGLLLFVILFNSFMWFLNREQLSRDYTLYLLTFLILQFSLLGLGKQYLWQENTWLANHINPLFASLSVLFLLRFSRGYLELRERLPRIDSIFRITQYFFAACAILALFPLEWAYTTSILGVNGLTLILNLAILPVAIIVIRQGYKPARLFLVAFFLLVVSVFAFVLKNFGLVPSNFFTDFGFQFGSSAEVILFSLGIVIRFRNVQREAIERLEELNQIKEEANVILEHKVTERTLEIAAQKAEIEEKNKEIIASITYARRIQQAILPTSERLSHVLPNSGIWYAPKDIVAGDFYWVAEKNAGTEQAVIFAVGDCTGHGVPGAMMSVLCTSALERALEQLSEPDPSALLELTSREVIEHLNRYGGEIHDGMDISLCAWYPEKGVLHWAGANRPLWILRGGQLIELEGTRRSIGKDLSQLAFESKGISLQSGDRILLFTDGLTDQFGGPDHKKYKASRLREAILHSGLHPVGEQVTVIRTTLEIWMEDVEQTDDITLLILGIE